MKSFVVSTNRLQGSSQPPPSALHAPSPQAAQCALLLSNIMPRILRTVRLAIANLDGNPLTLPQFRTLYFLHSCAGANLSATAEYLGLSLPSTSKLVDQLVRHAILTRDNDISDRRRMTLRLTDKGDALLKNAQSAVQLHLAGAITCYNPADLATLQNALNLLQQSFTSPLMESGLTPFPVSPDGSTTSPAPQAAIS